MNSISLSGHEKKWYDLAFILGIFTIAYNLVEGIIATWFGFEDETLALFGFGVDSFIELISGIGIVYMVMRIRQQPHSNRSGFEKTALKITGYSFYLLVAGLTASSLLSIYLGRKPVTTFWGVIVSLISIVVMLFLIYGKIKTGKALNSDAILADANCTKVCIYMSCVLLASSAIYEFTGFAYADALGTLGLAWFSYEEGKECFEKAASNKHCGCDH
ncbi:MAG TPA: cation transporter [Cyclobacteriaceae bacterium]|nr:cation transporter [Cyclobacteriaceae bacterium]HPW63645.1 cation transporter [Cyclobacteriaceae bacterium]